MCQKSLFEEKYREYNFGVQNQIILFVYKTIH